MHSQERPASADPLSKGKLLVVDDNDLVRRCVERFLSHDGWEVISAGDGTQALELFAVHRNEIRVVLLDMVMPGLGGAETYAALRQIDPEVRVVIFSGYMETASELPGVRGFLRKPCTPQETTEALDAALA